MTTIFRIVLLVVSLCTMVFMLKRIRYAKIQIEDSLFWILFSLMVILLAIFPSIADFMSGVIGIYSTTNFIFLFFIFILLIREFSMTIKISQLENKIKELTQAIAIKSADNNKKESEG
ncbi:MAG: DUF2304 domain-containing protein [Lachnospiraceae bacterium]|nr:DUF2304 domain-containing protein [Lachnospiraceae bacterium]MDE6252446.1 DUF2304 domain-containing protein [Lachnospiraceae bacterium]